MKAVVYTKYGPPDVLQLKDVEKPVPDENEILIKIYASTVTAVDCTFRKGFPLVGRLFTGLTGPKYTIPGTEFAGEVIETGSNEKLFKAGDRVFGTTDGHSAHTEYLCYSSDKLTITLMPDNLSYDEAAGCDGYLTALPFLRDSGNIRNGFHVLIYGASGSVGSSAVQLAKYYGAKVTGVCSTSNLELVKSIGADSVLDYTKEDFPKKRELYDIIFDTVGKISFGRCKRSLKENGIFLETSLTPTIFPQMLWTSISSRKKARIAFTGLLPVNKRTENLVFIKKLMEREKIKPVIDRKYPIKQITEAHEYVETGHKKGNVIITINQNDQTG